MTLYRYNQRTKIYPDGQTKTITFNRPVFNPHKLPVVLRKRSYKKEKNETRSDSLKRGIDKIYDIAMINDFDYFITFTLDKNKVDRYDYNEICKKLKNWLNNGTKRMNLKYLIVPELHKDGAVHFHGLVSGNFIMVDSGKVTKTGQPIYNLKNWHYGFTTCIPLYGERVAVARYICKYITKDTKRILGNLYYSGGGVKREPDSSFSYTPYFRAIGNEFLVGCTGLRVKYYESYRADGKEREECL